MRRARLAAVLAWGLGFASCVGGGRSTATASYPALGVYISVRLTDDGGSAGPRRDVVLRRRNESAVILDLPREPGPPSPVNLYGEPNRRIVLKDRRGVYALDVKAARLDPFEDACHCGYGPFLGVFDRDERGAWRFIPSRERAEAKLE
jgi:hypothetical protein